MPPGRERIAARESPEAIPEEDAEPVREAVAIVGPTASGKTALAVEVARRLDGEVISVDSRQAYRGLEVGTAAPRPGERKGIPHHGVAFLDPEERYSAGRFARLARRWIAEIRARDRVPVLAGGTGFFLDALLDPVFREPDIDPLRHRRLRRWLRDRSTADVRRWAARLDPPLFERLSTVDRQRAARTLELALLAGRPVTWWQDHGAPEASPLRAACYLLVLPGEEHRERIRRRAERLLDQGWREEAARLLEEGKEGTPAATAVGYPEVFALIRGEVDREEALEKIERATWRYARRQRTWFRHRLPADAVALDATEATGQLARRLVEDFETRGAGPAAGGRGEGGSRPARREDEGASVERGGGRGT